MRFVVLAFALVGCNGAGLPALTERCGFNFSAPALAGESACVMERTAGGMLFVLGGDRPITLSVSAADDSGYARLEATTTIRSQPGEVYGLTSLDFDGCNNWGGHAEWSIVDGWSLKLISTCSRANGPLFLNGAIFRIPDAG